MSVVKGESRLLLSLMPVVRRPRFLQALPAVSSTDKAPRCFPSR
jgi:hypothetical protein